MIKLLIVCSGNHGRVAPFISEQIESLKKCGVSVDIFPIKGKGILGYLKNLNPLYKKISQNEYHLIHAHYGLSGLLAVMQFKLPVICTFHGSDIYLKKNRFFSYLVSRLAVHNILTNIQQRPLLHLKKKYSVIPCGIDSKMFRPMDKKACRKKLKLKNGRRYILFSSSYDIRVKNSNLAIEAVSAIENCELIELKGYSRYEVVELMNACDLLLVTSHYETGPLVVKEALACNTPVVSTDVGDVKSLIDGIENCHITSYASDDIAHKINLVLESNQACEGRAKVQDYELEYVAKQIKNIYQSVLNKNDR